MNFTAHSMNVREQVVGHRDDILQYIMQLRAKKNLPLLETTAHPAVFYLDGYETTGIVLAHALHQLAKNKHVQKKLREEIKSFDKIDFDNINDLPYLDMVFNGSTYPACFQWVVLDCIPFRNSSNPSTVVFDNETMY